jgi:hypothetical protein
MAQSVGYNVTLNAVLYKAAANALCSKCCVATSSSSSSIVGGGETRKFVISEDEVSNNALYEKYGPRMVNKTHEEKENYLIDLVSKGEITADQALMLAIREKIDLTN